VVARDHGALAVPFEHDLGRAQDVARGNEADGDAVEIECVAGGDRFEAAGAVLAEAQFHHFDGFRGGEHGPVAGARMIAMAVRDDGTLDRACGVDVDAGGLAIEPAPGRVKPIVYSGSRHPGSRSTGGWPLE